MNALLIQAGIAVVILIILLFIVRKKIYRVILVVLFLAFGAFYGYKEYTRANTDLADVKADVKITATTLIHEYETNDSISNKKYLGKIIEVSGNVKETKKDESGFYTIVLAEKDALSSVRCSIDTTHQNDAALLTPGSSAVIRGACTGFNKDEMGLGSDVILNRCVIIQQKK